MKKNYLKNFLNKIKLKPYIIAEIGVNHEGSIDEAIKMVEAASKAGANIIKFQAYNANKLAHKNYAKAYDQFLGSFLHFLRTSKSLLSI